MIGRLGVPFSFQLLLEVPIMNGTSYLVSIDGSEESRSASFLAWELAKQTGARIVAQHVIDTAAVWRLLSYDRAGFIGSGVYMEAREKINSALYAIAESLMLSYTSQIEGQSLEFETCIDEGDPATEIARRAKDHDMVIVTHRRGARADESNRLFEKLSATCCCPVLVIGNSQKRWSKMRIFVSAEMIEAKSIAALYRLAGMLGLPAEIYIDSTVPSADAGRLELGGWAPALGVRSIVRSSMEETIATAPEDILLVVSLDTVAGQDVSRLKTRLCNFLDQSEENGLLLWTHTHKKAKTSSERFKLAS